MANEVNNGTWTATLDFEVAVAFEPVIRMWSILRDQANGVEDEANLDILEITIAAAKQRILKFNSDIKAGLGELQVVRKQRSGELVSVSVKKS